MVIETITSHTVNLTWMHAMLTCVHVIIARTLADITYIYTINAKRYVNITLTLVNITLRHVNIAKRRVKSARRFANIANSFVMYAEGIVKLTKSFTRFTMRLVKGYGQGLDSQLPEMFLLI